jgi:phosphoribosylamine--glycine ligase
MWTESGVKVIEFNARFGDPETEVVLPRMQTKLIEAIQKLLLNKPVRCRFSRVATVGVVLASNGYPGKTELGKPIDIPLDDPQVFHMGTTWIDSRLCNAGGRVAIAIGKKRSLAQAREEAYKKVESITNAVLFFRSDIAKF